MQEGLPGPSGVPSPVPTPMLRFSKNELSPFVSLSPLPPSKAAPAQAAAAAATAAAAAAAAGALPEVVWWQSCSRCGGGPLGAPQDLREFGDIPFVRFLDLLLTDNTLKGDGTRSKIQQEQQEQQQQQQQQQQVEREGGACRCPHYVFRDRAFHFASGNAVRTAPATAVVAAAAAAVAAAAAAAVAAAAAAAFGDFAAAGLLLLLLLLLYI